MMILQNFKGHSLGIGFTVGLLACLVGGSFLLANLIWGGYPSSEALGERYFKAIIDRKKERAINLADEGCRSLVRQYTKEEIDRFGGSQVRDVTMTVEHGIGSDDNYQAIAIQFEYRRNSSADWQLGKMGLGTTVNSWGLRHLTCGG